MRQASRRSWRIGQTHPVQVVFMAYRNTLQADALKLVAKKLQSSLAWTASCPEDGLAAYGDEGDDLMLALARKIVAGEEDPDSIESVFAQAQQVAAKAEALPVDASGPRRSWSQMKVPWWGLTPIVTTPASRSGRCSRGPSSWPRSRTRRSIGAGTKLQRSRCSSGRWIGSGTGNWSAPSVRPADAGEATAGYVVASPSPTDVGGFQQLRLQPTTRAARHGSPTPALPQPIGRNSWPSD